MQRITLALGIMAVTVAPLGAATVIGPGAADPDPGDPNPSGSGPNVNGGVNYFYSATLSGNDATAAGAIENAVGAWSWEDSRVSDPANPGDPVGWGHQSRWVLITLTEDAALTIDFAADAGVVDPNPASLTGVHPADMMMPSFTFYEGYEDTGSHNHFFNNDGDTSWTPNLDYLTHVDNLMETSVSRTYNLEAGQYTLVLGSQSSSLTAPPNQGFSLDLSTTAIPEPTTGTLAMLGALLFLSRRRR